MKIKSIAAILLTFLLACSSPEAPPAKDGPAIFRTTQPSHLYFKNIRSNSYRLETQAGTRVDLYRLRSADDTNERPILYPVIADNWMADEAYIFLETNDFEAGFSDTLRVAWQSERDSGRYELAPRDREGQFRFAQQLYEGLRSGYRFRIQTAGGDYAPLFENNRDRQNFLTTLRDYNKLVEKE